MYTLKIALKMINIVLFKFFYAESGAEQCSLNYLKRIENYNSAHMCTRTFSTTTPCSLPVVGSLPIGPCFLSHMGQADEQP